MKTTSFGMPNMHDDNRNMNDEYHNIKDDNRAMYEDNRSMHEDSHSMHEETGGSVLKSETYMRTKVLLTKNTDTTTP